MNDNKTVPEVKHTKKRTLMEVLEKNTFKGVLYYKCLKWEDVIGVISILAVDLQKWREKLVVEHNEAVEDNRDDGAVAYLEVITKLDEVLKQLGVQIEPKLEDE